MKRKEDELTSGLNQETNPWIERIGTAAIALATIAAYRHRKPIANQLKKAMARLPRIAESARTHTLDNLSLLIVKTNDPHESEIVFRGFKEQAIDEPEKTQKGSERFQIRPSEASFLVDKRTMVLAAEVITGSKIPGLSAVHTFEATQNPKDVFQTYYAVRLTPRRFKKEPGYRA